VIDLGKYCLLGKGVEKVLEVVFLSRKARRAISCSPHLQKVVTQHLTRIDHCYFQILQSVQTIFDNNEFGLEFNNNPDGVCDTSLAQLAAIFIAYYLTFAISPSFLCLIDKEEIHFTNSPVLFWGDELKDQERKFVNTFNKLTKVALIFVWWRHGFEEVCRHGLVDQPLAMAERTIINARMHSILRNTQHRYLAEGDVVTTLMDEFNQWISAMNREKDEKLKIFDGLYVAWRTSLGMKPQYVVKKFNTDGQVVPRDVYREISIMQNLAKKGGADSQYLLSVYNIAGKPQVYFGDTSIYMLMEPCLYNLIDWRRSLSEDDGRVPRKDRMGILEQLARALKHMHAENQNIPPVIHTDVKLGNIFVVQTRSEPGGLKIKLADFGFSSYLTTVGPSTLNAGNSFRDQGITAYTAPEVTKRLGSGLSSDMYSAGVCHAHLLGRKMDLDKITEDFGKMWPAHTDRKVDTHKAIQGALLWHKSNTRDVSVFEMGLLRTQLSENPMDRYTAEVVLDWLDPQGSPH